MVSGKDFVSCGRLIMGGTSGRIDTARKDFRAFFGITPDVCVLLWHVCDFDDDQYATVERVLWALMFLKVYATEPVLAALAKVTRKTYRKWVWYIVPKIAAAAKDVVCSG